MDKCHSCTVPGCIAGCGAATNDDAASVSTGKDGEGDGEEEEEESFSVKSQDSGR